MKSEWMRRRREERKKIQEFKGSFITQLLQPLLYPDWKNFHLKFFNKNSRRGALPSFLPCSLFHSRPAIQGPVNNSSHLGRFFFMSGCCWSSDSSPRETSKQTGSPWFPPRCHFLVVPPACVCVCALSKIDNNNKKPTFNSWLSVWFLKLIRRRESFPEPADFRFEGRATGGQINLFLYHQITPVMDVKVSSVLVKQKLKHFIFKLISKKIRKYFTILIF